MYVWDPLCFQPRLIVSEGWFATKIFHPNVSSAGEICVNTLKKDWKSTYGIEHILVTVKCLLIYPNPESALDEEAGKLLLENYSSYCDRAKLITSVHATPRTRPVEFDTPSPSEASSSTLATGFTSQSSTSSFTLPIGAQKASATKQASRENEGVGSTGKERHTSPAPLSIADANVGAGTPADPATTKAVKRAATGAAATNAEKRKKALKRL
jgi:ubiquitin-conjugating enzyme E2 S